MTGRLLIVAAATLWSTSGLFAKAPLLTTWPTDQRGLVVAFWRAAAAAIVLTPWVRRPAWSWVLVPACLCFALMNAAFLSAMTLTTEGVALWLQYSAPVWVFLAGVLLFKEQPTYRDRWMIVGVIGGVTLILLGQWSDAQRYPSNLAGAAWGTVSGIALAGVFLSLRRISHLDPLWVVALCHGAAALILAPFVLGQTALPTPAQLLWLVAFGGLQMGLPYVLFTRGLRTIPTHEASCLALLEPMLVCLWVYLVWGNAPEYRPPDAWTLVGGASILVGLGVRYAYPD